MPLPDVVIPQTVAERRLEKVTTGTAPPRLALRSLVVVVDTIVVALAFLAATAIRIPESLALPIVPGQVAAVSIVMIAGLALQGAYELERVRNNREVFARLSLGVVSGLGLVALASFVLPDIAVGRGVFAIHAVLGVVGLVIWRNLLLRTLREQALRPRAVILGEPEVARKIGLALSSARFGGAEVVGILTPDGKGAKGGGGDDASGGGNGAGGDGALEFDVLGDYGLIGDVVKSRRATQAIVVDGIYDAGLSLERMLALRQAGLTIEDGSAVYESVTGKLLVEKLTPGRFLIANAFEWSAATLAARHVAEVALASALLAFLSPLLALVAIAIRLDSRGPIFFRQERVGEKGRLFELFKFRTMRDGAEAETGPVWATENDSRVTRVGWLLRRTRLDEIPQLWNVVRGDMSFVGPRPERPHFVEMLRHAVPYYDHRHAVKPGITGWAQINFHYGSTIEDAVEKLHYDLYYIQNVSPLLDLEIVLGTIQKVLGATNRN